MDALVSFIDAKTVAGWLHCSLSHVYDMAKAGVLPGAVRIGGAWRFDEAVLRRWLAAGGSQPTDGSAVVAEAVLGDRSANEAGANPEEESHA